MSVKMPDCPWCGSNRAVYACGERNYWCRNCNREWDPEDDGEIGYGRPEVNAMRREERERRRKDRQRNTRGPRSPRRGEK